MNIEKILRKIERFIPKKLYKFFQPLYHYLLSLASAIRYRFPAYSKLIIVGITGTKGKTSTVEFVRGILEANGHKVASTSTIHFTIGDEEVKNKYKMSMPGRFFMQSFIRKAKKANCSHLVLEITSEGSKFFRNKWIPLDALIFTNLEPEHIESHGSFEKYKQAKLNILKGMKKDSVLIANKDSKYYEEFVSSNKSKSVTYSLEDLDSKISNRGGIVFPFKEIRIQSPLRGEFMISNMLAVAKLGSELGMSSDIIKKGLESVKNIPGRAEQIKMGQDFYVVVDYAHTPDSLEAIYKSFPNQDIIGVLGNTGGGRDKWKRKEMAKIAEQYCSKIILTNEDPYDENPMTIVQEMADTIEKKKVEIILDRKEAIKTALERANTLSAVIITGKGTDPYIMGPNGTKLPWSDKEVVQRILKNILLEKQLIAK